MPDDSSDITVGAVAEVAQGSESVVPRRINVAVSTATLAATEHLIAGEQVSVTESVRRLLAYGDVIYRAITDQSAAVVVRRADGAERDVVLL